MSSTPLNSGSVELCLLDVIVCELFENLTVDFVFERLRLQRPFKYLIGELIDGSHPFGRIVAHIFHHRYKDGQGSLFINKPAR